MSPPAAHPIVATTREALAVQVALLQADYLVSLPAEHGLLLRRRLQGLYFLPQSLDAFQQGTTAWAR